MLCAAFVHCERGKSRKAASIAASSCSGNDMSIVFPRWHSSLALLALPGALETSREDKRSRCALENWKAGNAQWPKKRASLLNRKRSIGYFMPCCSFADTCYYWAKIHDTDYQ